MGSGAIHSADQLPLEGSAALAAEGFLGGRRPTLEEGGIPVAQARRARGQRRQSSQRRPARRELLGPGRARPLGQAAQGGGGVPVPGGVGKRCSCGAWGRGSAGTVVLGGRLGLVISEVFSNLWL